MSKVIFECIYLTSIINKYINFIQKNLNVKKCYVFHSIFNFVIMFSKADFCFSVSFPFLSQDAFND